MGRGACASHHYLVPNVTTPNLQMQEFIGNYVVLERTLTAFNVDKAVRIAEPCELEDGMPTSQQQQQQQQLAPTISHHEAIQASGHSPSATMSFMSCHGLSSEHCKPRCPPSQLLVAMGCLSHVASTERACCGCYFQLRQCDA